MDVVGIICEYNPFHNGHIKHINATKKLFPDSVLVLVLSGYVTERGDISIYDKWDKTEIALSFGVDIVVELPFIYTLHSADNFAYNSVYLLDKFNIDYLVFGSESDNIDVFKNVAKIHDDVLYKEYLDSYLKKGYSLPKASELSLDKFDIDYRHNPNDILGLAYIKAIRKINNKIVPISILREDNYLSNIQVNNIMSATGIRNLIKDGKDISAFAPEISVSFINGYKDLNDFFVELKHIILINDSLIDFFGVDEGIENILKDKILGINNIDDFINSLVSKRYTYSRIKRMCASIIFGLKKDFINNNFVPSYARILGLNLKGREYLSNNKNKNEFDILSNFSKNFNEVMDFELQVSRIYNSKYGLRDNEITNNIVKKGF